MFLGFNSINPTRIATSISLVALSVSLAACGGETTSSDDSGKSLSGKVQIDGSSTVFPISGAMAEEFQKLNPGVRVTVGVSGTGGGFEKFCNGEVDITNASRPIKKSEIDACQKAGIKFIELPVARDALAMVVHPENDFVDCLTVEELKKIWQPQAQGKITNWNQVRPSFPDRPLRLYGPGTDSGTFDYFTDAVVGKEGASRGDYTASEDDNVLVQGVSRDTGALGYFGLAYLEENQNKLKAVKIDNGDSSDGEGCVAPSQENAENGTYQPLSRPLLIYTKAASADKFAVNEFVEFYLQKDNAKLVEQVGYVPLPDEVYEGAQARFQNEVTGTLFEGGSTVGVNLKEAL